LAGGIGTETRRDEVAGEEKVEVEVEVEVKVKSRLA
jgi:hypothetical protein